MLLWIINLGQAGRSIADIGNVLRFTSETTARSSFSSERVIHSSFANEAVTDGAGLSVEDFD